MTTGEGKALPIMTERKAMQRLLLIPAVVALTLALCNRAPAHSWYPDHCCSDKDCYPVRCEEVKAIGDYYYWRGHAFAKNASYPSKDGNCHVCIGSYPRCLFFGGVS